MKKNIVTISDIHWGALDSELQWDSLEFIFEFLEKFSGKPDYSLIDMIVILGDYFDNKLPLNSQEAQMAIKWFHRLYNYCVKKSIVLRLVQGTREHDNDQLETFSTLEGKYTIHHGDLQIPLFRIIRSTTVEESLKDVKCVYCPDESIQTDIYEQKFINEILEIKDLGFFHGSFDVVYGSLLESNPEILKRNNVVFHYNLWNSTIKGPMIAGHWHDGKQYDDLYYTGSPTRWKFREDEPKGFLFLQYETDDGSYYVQKIQNPLCPEYITYEIYSNLYDEKDYGKICSDIKELLDQINKMPMKGKLRILFYIVDEKPENDVFLSSIRQAIIGYNDCKITIRNKLKEKKKKIKEKEEKEDDAKYGFIFKKESPEKIIKQFIKLTTKEDEDLPPTPFIRSKIEKYYKES